MSVYYEPGAEGLADSTHHLQAALEAVAETARKLKEERDEARRALREIASADWKTSGELRGMARRVLEGEK